MYERVVVRVAWKIALSCFLSRERMRSEETARAYISFRLRLEKIPECSIEFSLFSPFFYSLSFLPYFILFSRFFHPHSLSIFSVSTMDLSHTYHPTSFLYLSLHFAPRSLAVSSCNSLPRQISLFPSWNILELSAVSHSVTLSLSLYFSLLLSLSFFFLSLYLSPPFPLSLSLLPLFLLLSLSLPLSLSLSLPSFLSFFSLEGSDILQQWKEP